MISRKLSEKLNEQINKEIYSAYLYQDISNYYAVKGLKVFSKWFAIQSGEELDHARKINGYLLDEGITPVLGAIAAPDSRFEDLKAPLVAAYEHEKFITSSINDIFRAADDEGDYRTKRFLGWFIDEQAEEEKNASDLITEYDLFGSTSQGLFMLDSKLGERK